MALIAALMAIAIMFAAILAFEAMRLELTAHRPQTAPKPAACTDCDCSPAKRARCTSAAIR